jgi:hypothetical protein
VAVERQKSIEISYCGCRIAHVDTGSVVPFAAPGICPSSDQRCRVRLPDANRSFRFLREWTGEQRTVALVLDVTVAGWALWFCDQVVWLTFDLILKQKLPGMSPADALLFLGGFHDGRNSSSTASSTFGT